MQEFVDIGFKLNNQLNTLEMQNSPRLQGGDGALVKEASPWAQGDPGAAAKSCRTKPSTTAHKNWDTDPGHMGSQCSLHGYRDP